MSKGRSFEWCDYSRIEPPTGPWETGPVFVLESADTKKVDEIPKQVFRAGLFTSTNILIALLVIFVILNLVLVVKRKKNKPKINPQVIKQIKSASKNLSEEELQEMLRNKGWSEEAIREILKRVK